MPKAKPLVAIACICEKVLQEPDKVASLIRIVDTFTLSVPTEKLAGAGIQFTAFVGIKAGEAVGAHEIELVLRKPNGTKGEPHKWPVVLSQPYEGANLTVTFALVGKEGAAPPLGTYWWDILCEGEILTSIPFRLIEEEAPANSTAEHTTN